ncbi:MAG: dihydropteroate synthase [Puniceicoccales bacterium]|jgi:dihydropteroate synthase|nr:dihydropteroate synthase [Puniceicoccales bacterium]
MQEAHIVGILNLTPDSFSDGGLYNIPDKALEHAHRMWQEGASWIDVGGESTRPGFTPLEASAEWDRIAAVVKTLVQENIPVSVDTRKLELIPWALDAGASMINFQGSVNDTFRLIASREMSEERARWVFMYNGRSDDEAKRRNLSQKERRFAFFDRCSEELAKKNIPAKRVIFDLGIGFGSSEDESIALLRQQADFIRRYEYPWMLATSRKSFMKRWCRDTEPHQRLAPSLATALVAYQQGCRYFRVHDVQSHRECLQALREIYG